MKYLLPLLFLAAPALAQVPLSTVQGDNYQDGAQTTTMSTTGTISWYMAHTDERKATIQRCDNDPGHLQNDPDCINAKKADNQAGLNNFKSGVGNTIQGAADFFNKIGN
jgi:hypothetical protein